jgi:hypothetical protein
VTKQVQRQVGDEREGVRRVHRQRRDHREDVGAELLAQALAVLVRQESMVARRMSCCLQLRHQRGLKMRS